MVGAEAFEGVAGWRIGPKLKARDLVMVINKRPFEAGIDVGQAGGIVVNHRVEPANGNFYKSGQPFRWSVFKVGGEVLKIDAGFRKGRTGRTWIQACDFEAAALGIKELRSVRPVVPVSGIAGEIES